MKVLTAAAAVLLIIPSALAWDTPVNLGPTINTGYNEWYPVLPEDGSYMLFVSDRPDGHGGMDIWISHWTGTQWGEPENLGTSVNTAYDESAPFLAENDTKLFFVSTDPAGHGLGDVWYCDIDQGVPGTRTNMGSPINGSSYDCCPVLSHDGNTFLICSSRPGGAGSLDVWISQKSGGVWQQPWNAGSAVNTTETDCPRWISGSDQELVIVSSGPGGYGATDLYSAQFSGDTLTGKTNLGPVINSEYIELGPGFLDNGGTIGGTIFFGSSRPGGYGYRDIWQSGDAGALKPCSWASIKASF